MKTRENSEGDVWESSIYSEKIVENLLDDDILTAEEAGFMKGYIDAAYRCRIKSQTRHSPSFKT